MSTTIIVIALVALLAIAIFKKLFKFALLLLLVGLIYWVFFRS